MIKKNVNKDIRNYHNPEGLCGVGEEKQRVWKDQKCQLCALEILSEDTPPQLAKKGVLNYQIWLKPGEIHPWGPF